MKEFVRRHLRRPSYDYRQVWQTFTERIATKDTAEKLGAEFVSWLSGTFEVLSASFWLAEDEARRLTLLGSTVVEHRYRPSLSFSHGEYSSLIGEVLAFSRPVTLDSLTGAWADSLRRSSPNEFERKGGKRFVLPLAANAQLLGLVVLGDRVRGRPYTAEDLELLKCLGDQAAANLLMIRLSERVIRTREMETLHTISTFIAHDLKNTAATLSLMLQNLPRHYDNAAYREDALRSLAQCVRRINDLVGQLTVLRKGLEVRLEVGDLNAVVPRSG
jgi:signal transduction histidine kinase